MITLNLPRPPTTNNLYGNRKRGGGRYKTRRYGEWLVAAGWDVREAKQEKLVGDVSLRIALGRDINKDGNVSRKRMDASNFIKSVEDLLVEHRLIVDDSYVQSITCYWSEEVPPKRAFVTVFPADAVAREAA